MTMMAMPAVTGTATSPRRRVMCARRRPPCAPRRARLDVLDHDDCAIHQQTDGDREAAERHQICRQPEQAIARTSPRTEGQDQRDHERGAQVPEEEKQQHEHEHDGLPQCLVTVPTARSISALRS